MADNMTAAADTIQASSNGVYPVPSEHSAEAVKARGGSPGVLDELLVGQVFLVQATIESASALGDGLQAARSALNGDGDVGEVLKRTGRGVFRPYSERFQLFRQLPRQRQD